MSNKTVAPFFASTLEKNGEIHMEKGIECIKTEISY